jgi:ammonia channel protein AmtB
MHGVLQMTFAIITPALMLGAFAERMKLTAVLAFTTLFSIFIYYPTAHAVWGGAGKPHQSSSYVTHCPCSLGRSR